MKSTMLAAAVMAGVLVPAIALAGEAQPLSRPRVQATVIGDSGLKAKVVNAPRRLFPFGRFMSRGAIKLTGRTDSFLGVAAAQPGHGGSIVAKQLAVRTPSAELQPAPKTVSVLLSNNEGHAQVAARTARAITAQTGFNAQAKTSWWSRLFPSRGASYVNVTDKVRPLPLVAAR